ncbi:U4/U5/U6 small nuclear ribonucleoprotein prp3 [Rhizina undulata]
MTSLKRPPQDESPGNPPKKTKPGPDRDRIEQMLAEARAKAALRATAAKAKLGTPTPTPAPSAPAPTASQTAAERIAAMRNRVANAVSRSSASAVGGSASLAAAAGRNSTTTFRREEEEEGNKARGGLDIGLHPALLVDTNDSVSARKKAITPKFATTMANRREGKGKKVLELSGPSPDVTDPTKNPYYDPNLTAKSGTARRVSKTLVFNQKGKYIEQANALRRQAALEAMKKRIAEAARKVGIDEDMQADKAFAREEPPEIEWWDQGLTANATYADLDTPAMRIDTHDSIITHYIQHPIQLEPPMEKHIPPPKPLPLTKKEQKKIRRQRRAEIQKEKQAKVRLGLEPPPPPKVKKSNLMRVLGEEAVKDPTAVEARVNREIKERLDGHLATNEERKLTKEQRLEKLALNQEKDLQKGIYCLVFRIETLANGKHRYKININADQLALTGICIMNPKFNLVLVEGGQHSITKYKKLMLNRMDWTENIAPNGEREEQEGVIEEDVDMSTNACTLVWEGELKSKGFKKFSSEKCPTEALAKERLARAKMENMWTQAKNAVVKE